MSLDVIHDRKKAWKASQADFDDVFSRSNRLCSVCLTEQEIVALLSMTEFLYWPTRWVKAEGDVDPAVVSQFAQNLERHLMMACCDDNLPIQYRYSAAGVLQRSLNAGGNWTDSPEYDPRVYSPQFPPVPGDDGDDKKCIAATGAAALIKEQVGDQLTDDMSRYTLGQLLTDWVKTMIETSNPFLALVTVITNQVFALVIAVLRPALTDSTYDQLKCIFYCHMADDASVNDAQWAAIRSDILAQITGIAGVFFEHLVYMLGTGGTTNLIRSGGAAEGDCSSCGCGDCIMNPYMTEAIGGGTDITMAGGSITLTAVVEGDHYAATIWWRSSGDTSPTFDANKCGTVLSWVALSGTVVATTYNDCGSATLHNPGDPIGKCMCQAQWLGSAPFTVQVEGCDCP